MAIGELILTGDTLNVGRIKINNFYSGNTILWSGSVGSNSIIRNNVDENLGNSATGPNTMAAGNNNSAGAPYAIAFWGSGNSSSNWWSGIFAGENNSIGGAHSFIGGGSGNIIPSSAYGNASVIAGGNTNSANTGNGIFIGGGISNRVSSNRGSIVGGQYNVVTGNFSTIAGGHSNTASGYYSSVGGGQFNRASGNHSNITGGQFNTATSIYSAVVGGFKTSISGVSHFSFIGAGYQNTSNSLKSGIIGGHQNSARGESGFIGAGIKNKVIAKASAIIGGSGNTIYSTYSAIDGGIGNKIGTGTRNFIAGGYRNTIQSIYAISHSGIVGGYKNFIQTYGSFSFIGGGRDNVINNRYGSILAGRSNRISSTAKYSIAGGRGCYASHNSSMAIGGGAQTRSTYSFVLGNQATFVSNPANNTVRLDTAGGTADGTWQTGAADYAEYFEWADGNPDYENRFGYFVSLKNNKIEIGNSNLIGIVSSAPGFIGDAAELKWNNIYQIDDWGVKINVNYKKYEINNNSESFYVFVDEDGNKFLEVPNPSFEKGIKFEGDIPINAKAENVSFHKISPDYVPTNTEYIPRSKRKEWAPIGLLGKIRVRTAHPITENKISVNENGLAVNGDKYDVLEIIRPHTQNQYGIIKVLFK